MIILTICYVISLIAAAFFIPSQLKDALDQYDQADMTYLIILIDWLFWPVFLGWILVAKAMDWFDDIIARRHSRI